MSDDRKPKQTSSHGRLGRLARAWRAGRAGVSPFHGADRDDSSSQAWRKLVRRRVLVVLTCLAVWGVGVQARLVQLQVVRHEKYRSAAESQQQSKIKIEALRGDIVDRNGRMLAYSVKAHAIYADPTLVTEPVETAAALCRALADCTAKERVELAKKLQEPRQHIYIRRSRQVSPEQVARVAALDLDGVGFQSDSGRYYPNRSLAAHVLGWVGQDNAGQGGIELVYERAIRGESGIGHAQVDNRRRRVETRIDKEPRPGANIELTIDAHLQHVAEEAVKDGVLATRARSATAVVMDPRTGEVLAMASYPTFDPNVAGRSRREDRRNRATEDVYEPGSTFKLVTASAALQEGIVTPHELIDTNPGFIKFPGRKPIDEVNGRNYGVLTFEDSLVKSSNVAAIRVGLRTGIDIMADYVRRFGFGQKLSNEFPGQSSGIFNPDALNDSGLASVSMGYQVAVTPLQMATAVGAVANGGLLMEPRLVRAVVRDGVRQEVPPRVIRRVIEESTARTLTGMMKNVVSRGTAKAAVIEGYPAAGKTGTSTRLAEGGGYSRSDYNASFVGFVPADKPAITVLVVVDSPRTSIYGGAVAAPIFRQIAEGALLHLGIAPEGDGRTPMTVRAGSGDSIRTQRVSVSPQPPSLVRTGGFGPVPTPMPDLRGLSLREALRVLGSAGLSAHTSGAGFVDDQWPAAGTPIDPGAVSRLSLRRDPALREGDMP
jgi:cell division protein FtsI/penicillin-binding protein 2